METMRNLALGLLRLAGITQITRNPATHRR